jgi:hypothetical protein
MRRKEVEHEEREKESKMEEESEALWALHNGTLTMQANGFFYIECLRL